MKRAAGFTLIELLLVLGVLALMAAAAFWVYDEVQFRRAVTMEGRNIQSVVASISGQSAQFGSTAYLGVGYAKKTSWNINLPQCLNGWCNDFGSVTKVSPASCWVSGMGAVRSNNGFELQYSDLSKRACVGLLNALGGATPSAVTVMNPNRVYVVFCKPGTLNCSDNGTRQVTQLGQLPNACRGDFKVSIEPQAAADICKTESNRFNLLYYPAPGKRL